MDQNPQTNQEQPLLSSKTSLQTPFQKPTIKQSFNWARTIGLSLGILCLGLAIAYIGFYLSETKQKPTQQRFFPTPTIVTPTVTPIPAPVSHYMNTLYGYSLDYPADLHVIGEGLQATNETAPDVTLTTGTVSASPDPKRVFHITVKDKSLLTVSGKSISSYTPMELVNMDLDATVNNKNIYVSTLSPVTQLQPLPKNILSGYTFSVRAKGYQTTNDGVLWDLGDYVITELDSIKYHYVIVYSDTEEMRQVTQTLEFTK